MQDCTVQTPQGQDYVGKCYAGKQVHMAWDEIAVVAGVKDCGIKAFSLATYSVSLPY